MKTNLLPHGAETFKLHGVMVHSTGDGIPREAAKNNASLMDTAVKVYTNMGNIGPHYCIAPDGEVVKFREENVVAYHCKQEHRREFLDGSWQSDYNRLSRDVVTWWKNRWPGVKSPAHLYPGVRPNECYIGVELIPAGMYVKNPTGSSTWKPNTAYADAIPGRDQRYTIDQYYALARIIKNTQVDVSKPGVLVGHEDIEPYNRGGYDPGAYHGWFSWNLLNGILRKDA